ncbi:MAG TPA: bifunctional salicylyl-CoA 5-hydroxylase/oxidoreductase, partial [Actinomycetota bacterium]
IPYAPWSPTPRAMDRTDMDEVVAGFAAAAANADRAGFDLLELNMADGYLLATFLSPLANRRTDPYGGSLGDRARFPLEVFDAVRSVWPEGKPLGVAITATDWAPGGSDLDEAVAVAGWLKERGCDLVHVRAGQTTPWTRPVYGRFFLVPMSDRVRNEAGLATMVGGGLTTYDEVDTIVAAGRADLCLLDRAPA